MKSIAGRGYQHGQSRLEPSECLEVAETILERCTRIQKNLDLRILVQGFRDRLQWSEGLAELHWVDLVESRLMERPSASMPTGVRALRKADDLAYVKTIAHLPPAQRLQAWKEKTGKSQAALYRFLAILGKTPQSENLRGDGASETPINRLRFHFPEDGTN